MINCANCGKLFEPKRHNMKYCKNECCREATNKKLVAKYHERKNNVVEKNRKCSRCESKLSRYNKESLCYICLTKKESEYKEQILRELGYAS